MSSRVHESRSPCEAIFKWQTAERKYPLHAGGFNHRAEALYKAHEESPQNANVKDAIQRGLRKVKILHWATPDNVFVKVVSLLNQFHQGAGVNHWDVMHEALKLESAWKADCTLTRLNTYNPRYQAAYETFVINKSASSEYDGHFRSKLSYYNAISLAHNMQALDFLCRIPGLEQQSRGLPGSEVQCTHMHCPDARIDDHVDGRTAEVCREAIAAGDRPGSPQVLCAMLNCRARWY